MTLYENVFEAFDVASAAGMAVLPVCGGFKVCSWSTYWRWCEDEAEELISEGWGPDDLDDLVEAFNFTPAYAADVCKEMRKIYEEIGIVLDAEGVEV